MRSVCVISFVILVLLSGCAQKHLLLKIKPDGSGTIEDTWLSSTNPIHIKDEIRIDEKHPASSFSLQISLSKTPLTKEQLRENAHQYGAVEFADLDDVERENFKGQCAKYKFKDIEQVHLEKFIRFPGTADPQFPSWTTIRAGLAHFQDGRTQIQLHVTDSPPNPPTKDAEANAKVVESRGLVLQQALKGARVWIEIEVKGDVVKTEGAAPTQDKRRFNVFDANLGNLLDGTDAVKSGKTTDMQLRTLRELLKQKVTAMKEVRIEFVK